MTTATRTTLTIVAVTAAMAAVLVAMGRVPICTCGTVKLWHGVVFSSENSQHLTDWYSFTHVTHGVLFYGALWVVGRRWPVTTRVILATITEASWEIVENTDFIINRYREVTISLDYFGDSVINSVMDVVSMLAGFLIAWRLPTWATVALILAVELFLAWAIRDNLAINILMLVYPLDVVRTWQTAG
jgi:Protein of unknown function (DUF2585)